MDQDAILEGMLGYLNLSNGRPNANFRRSVDAFYRLPASIATVEPWARLASSLRAKLDTVAGQSSAFEQVGQARSVVTLIFDHLLPAYRAHHRDLLFHLDDRDLFQPFFLARAFEATLEQEAPWEQTDRIVAGALGQLNGFLGHRPVATLENERKVQPYDHERVCPIPLYLRDAGVACGKYHDLIERTLELLAGADSATLFDVAMELDRLDELSLDPRAYDHEHPANGRPAYLFGEWDPHLVDNQGRYRRFVLRSTIPDALLEWLATTPAAPEDASFAAAAALAGALLLASGMSGHGPDAHDSQTTFATLVPRVARCRDRFYADLLSSLTGSSTERFRAEAAKTGQPFGSARQHLNRYLAQRRAEQVRSQQLALIEARMGYPEAARRHADVIPVASVRIRCEIQIAMTTARAQADRGALAPAAELVARIEDLLHRGIECGALVDPWNILGFGGQFSLFPALENSVADPRVDQLLSVVDQVFSSYEAILSKTAADGAALHRGLAHRLGRFADWWDRFATTEVAAVRRVSGRESAGSALFVARVLATWRREGAATGDVAFWNHHARGFTTARAYGSVVEALMSQNDMVASRALLMRWLSQAEEVPLQEGRYAFDGLCLAWMMRMRGEDERPAPRPDGGIDDRFGQIRKFFDYLEANAGEYWRILSVTGSENGSEAHPDADADSQNEGAEETYSAAYEGVTYRDSAEDGHEGATIEEGASFETEDFLDSADRLIDRLGFQSTLARLWRIVATESWPQAEPESRRRTMREWLRHAERNERDLGRLMDDLHARTVGAPTGSHESTVDYDRRQTARYEVLTRTIDAAVEMSDAVRKLSAACDDDEEMTTRHANIEEWERQAIVLQRGVWAGDREAVRRRLPALLAEMSKLPLLFVPLDRGGAPRALFRSRQARDFLRRLTTDLPALGLFRHANHVLLAAVDMERSQTDGANHVTEFNLLFEAAYRSVLERLVDLLSTWEETKNDDDWTIRIVGPLVQRFSRLWLDQIRHVRISELERPEIEAEWDAIVAFIRRYGRDLFTQKFLSLNNLRGLLSGGVERFLDYAAENRDPLNPLALSRDLDVTISRAEAARRLETVARAVLENYQAYLDYNATTTQSDYGENLHLLLDLLRIQARYERDRWAFRPAFVAHRVLSRRGRPQAAILLQRAFTEETRSIAERHVDALREAEERLGLRVGSIANRLDERFVRPLQLDRVLALVASAMREARDSPENRDRSATDWFALFEAELEDYAESARDTGLGVPAWVRELELEVQRNLKTPFAELASDMGRPPFTAIPITFDEWQQQFDRWDEPLEAE